MLRLLVGLILSAILLSACDKFDHQSLQVPQFVEKQEGNFVLTNGHARLTVSPAIGGRVMSIKYDQTEILAIQNTINNQPNAFGAVLWSSPQTEWNWPPLPELDHHAYSVSCEHDKSAIVLTSEIEPKTGYQFVKSYSLGEGAETFKIKYTIINHSKDTKFVAAIENVRVQPSGIAFFPKGDTEPSSGLFYPLDVEIRDDIVWHHFDPKKIRPDHHKVMMDGKEGWLAYKKGKHLLVQRFDDVAANQSPDTEREIEIFGHSAKTFAEIKHQSGLKQLAPGESLSWEVEWQVKELPSDVDLHLGSQYLVEAARSAD